MNSKISSGEVLTLCIYIIAVSFFALINRPILKISGNTSLLVFFISILIGIIPVFMIIYISKKMDTSLYKFLIDKFKILGYPILFLLIILTIYLIYIFTFVFLNFIVGQFLTKTSYYFISITIFIMVIYPIKKGIEVIARVSFLLFVFSFTILMFFFLTLLPFIDIGNLKPYIDTNNINILKSIFLVVSTTTFPLVLVLNEKNKVTDKKLFPRKILFGYLISMIIMFLFLLFTILIYGIDFSKILTYPTYSLFKEVQILGFIERIENIVSIIFFAGFYIVFVYYIYFIHDNIKEMFKIRSKKINNFIITTLSLSISTISVYTFKNYNISYLVNYSHYILSIFFIIILIIFIRCLFIKNNN